jgi:hypothetical protein
MTETNATRAAGSSAPAGSAFNPDFGWYCPTCERAVQNEHVTFQETHDPRCGGCGNPVEPIKPNVPVSGVESAAPRRSA